MKLNFKLQWNHMYVWGILALYFVAAFMSIQAAFTNISYSDGIVYLIMDIVLLFSFIMHRKIRLNSFVLCSFALALYQVLLIAITGDYISVMRSITWGMIFVGMYQHLDLFPEDNNYLVRYFAFVLCILTFVVLLNEIRMRNNLVQSGINTVYWIEMGLPLAFAVKNKRTRLTICILIGFAVILSLKATAILAFLIPLLIAILVDAKLKKRTISRGIVLLVFLVLIAYMVFPYVETYVYEWFGISWYDKILYSSESGGSGRIDIWLRVIELQTDSSLKQWIFGHGYNGVVNATGHLSAHNDLLEILFDYGILGMFLYLGIYVYLIKCILKLLRNKRKSTVVLAVSLTQVIILSMFSHLVIYPHLLMTVSLIWAFCAAESDQFIESFKE